MASILVIGGTRAKFHFISDIPAPDTRPHIQLFLSGKHFQPEAEYNLTLKNGDQITLRANAEGEINSAYILPSEISTNKVLDFYLSETNTHKLDSATLDISINTEKKNITWNGRFFDPAQRIDFTISNANTHLKSDTTSDWNGHFQKNVSYTGIDLLKETTCFTTPHSAQELCLSFGIHRAPELIEVLTVGNEPPTSDDTFSPNFAYWTKPDDCTPSDRDVELSLCSDSHVGGLQERLSRTYYDFTRMTLQLSAGMMQQTGFIGALFDAKHQLETQLLLWKRQEQAHNDYHPAEQLCSIATMTQDLVNAELTHKLNTMNLTRALSYEDQNPINSNSAQSIARHNQYRIRQFQSTYCAPTNFNNTMTDELNAFGIMCEDMSNGRFARLNRDVDYTRLVSIPKTLDVDLADHVVGQNTTIIGNTLVTQDVQGITADEEDILSMGRLLFGHKPMEFPQPQGIDSLSKSQAMMNDPKFVHLYQEHRSVSAIRNVARHSYANLVGMKSSGSGFNNTYIRALLADFGMNDDYINRFIGENPSYFAQMHLLTKQIFQSPNFYTNLITQEANIARFEATMEALTLMANRDRYEALLRKELLLSLLVEMKIRHLEKNGIDRGLRAITARHN